MNQGTRARRTFQWRWNAAWFTLAVALTLSIGGAIWLGAGLADPPRAGPLLWEDPSPQHWVIKNSQEQYRYIPLPLPAPPFTIEAIVRFSGNSAPGAGWWLSLTDGEASSQFNIFNDGYFQIKAIGHKVSGTTIWTGPVEFPHLKGIGEFNKLALDVAADQSATLRLNDEIAWKGTLGFNAAAPWRLFVGSTAIFEKSATLTWERLAIYAPRGS